ncbi:hypothetical protein LUZ60_002350 [Juncus effusus]|nr:hypothetical protein LUZ60_002350 [Juncus effusus]
MGLGDSAYSYSERDNLSVDGTNLGATMKIHQCPQAVRSNESVCINIYVNNNIQGVTNSVMLGSKMIMRDPGARVSFGGMDREDGVLGFEKVGVVFKGLPSFRVCFGLICSVLIAVVACMFVGKFGGVKS